MEAFLAGRSRSKSSSANKSATDASSGSGAKKRQLPWVEKYRPKCVSDISHQDEVVSVLKRCVQGADLPNLLFYGPPGTGKTSSILALAREMFGADMYRHRVLELNASDERGIQVVREKIKTFSQMSASSVRPDGRPCPPLKIVILDEADSMTSSAQAALRRTMEKESKTTRFCLICNYITHIIEPLTSRCSKFRFKPLSLETQLTRLEFISSQEKINCSEQVLKAIVSVSEGDLRKAITLLQSSYQLKGKDEIEEEDILDIAGVIPQDDLDDLMKSCHSNSYDRLEGSVKNIVAAGYSATQCITQIHDRIVEHAELSDSQKSVICERIGLVDKRLTDGADEYLQLLDLCSVIMTQICQAGS